MAVLNVAGRRQVVCRICSGARRGTRCSTSVRAADSGRVASSSDFACHPRTGRPPRRRGCSGAGRPGRRPGASGYRSPSATSAAGRLVTHERRVPDRLLRGGQPLDRYGSRQHPLSARGHPAASRSNAASWSKRWSWQAGSLVNSAAIDSSIPRTRRTGSDNSGRESATNTTDSSLMPTRDLGERRETEAERHNKRTDQLTSSLSLNSTTAGRQRAPTRTRRANTPEKRSTRVQRTPRERPGCSHFYQPGSL
jgi:hypothetical protein